MPITLPAAAPTTTVALPQPRVLAGTTRAAITASPVAGRTVFLKAAADNADTILVGDVSVTSAGGGQVLLELAPGEGVSLDILTTGGLYAVSPTNNQSLFVGVIA